MINNFFTLRHIAGILDSLLKGVTIVNAFSQERDILVLALEGREEHLVVSCRGDFPTCYLHDRMARARRNSADVMDSLSGSVIHSVSIHPGDRVVTAAFESGIRLVIQFFGTQSNAFVVQGDGTISDAFRNARSLIGTVYTPRPSQPLPSAETVISRLGDYPEMGLTVAFKNALPTLGSTLANELAYRSGLPVSTEVRRLEEHHREKLLVALQTAFDEFDHPAPVIYFSSDGIPRLLSIIPLSHMEPSEKREFPGIHEAIQTYYALRQSTSKHTQEKTRVLAVLENSLDRTTRTLSAMRKDEEEHDRATLYQEYGSLLMANLTAFSTGGSEVTLSAHEGEMKIPLNPMLTPVQNAQRYFEKAKHSRLAHQQAAERQTVLRDRVMLAEFLIRALQVVSTREELEAFMNSHPEELEEFGLGKKGPTPKELPFRMFVVEGGFEVWAGKDNASNDLLTLRHAKPNDLWFHARGSPGSHVVLRVSTGTGVPGKRSKQQAAAIAAYYSKMRNAKMVPVTMTERKYVRKPKGAAPGSVVVTREDTLFAEPQLPEKHSLHSSPDHP